ncbi:MAG: hypothetical protein WC363_04690 [Candidatus Izemoplasmatales bacterium]|jgi:hypothetical protein
MKIALFPIVSSLHNESVIDNQTLALIDEIKQHGEFEFYISSLDELYDSDLSLILVQSGGSEAAFLAIKKHLHAPYYLLTYGTNNSLAASMEILSYLKNNNEAAEILHGSPKYIAKRLQDLKNHQEKAIVNLGIVGKPSDWLIASHVDKEQCLKRFNINLIDIPISELTDLFEQADAADFIYTKLLVFDQYELNQAKKVSVSLRQLIDNYQLEGLTVRCFDLLSSIHTTGCLGLSFLNKDGIVGTCEGDVPAMLSMYFLKKITGQCGFQANPSQINTEAKTVVLAHCTLPLNMATDFIVTTHFESGIGVALKGTMQLTPITVFKLSNDLKHYYVEEGSIIANLNDPNLCRTQILIQLPDVNYFLSAPFGNHHIVVYGSYKKAIEEYMQKYW